MLRFIIINDYNVQIALRHRRADLRTDTHRHIPQVSNFETCGAVPVLDVRVHERKKQKPQITIYVMQYTAARWCIYDFVICTDDLHVYILLEYSGVFIIT